MLKKILYSDEYQTTKEKRYKMNPSDNIWSLSRDFTGNPEAYKELIPCNAHIRDILRVYPGELIVLPNRWIKLKRLIELGVYDTPKQFGADLVKLLIREWVTFYQFNAPELNGFVKRQGRIMSEIEVISVLNREGNKNTLIAFYWVLLMKFRDIFVFKLFKNKKDDSILLCIEGVYYKTDVINAVSRTFDLILIETKDITEIDFNAMFGECLPQLCVEDVLKIAAFHEHLDLTQITDIANILSITVRRKEK